MVVLDVMHLFTVFGGPSGVLSVLGEHQPDVGLNYNQVQMWHHRGQIPAKWIGAVLYCVLSEGHTITEFLIDTDELLARDDD